MDVPAGRYALVHPERSIIEFFSSTSPRSGKWAGRTFVNQQASDDKYPVRGARRDEVLARIAVDPQAAMIRYGHELGRCGNCGRTLTDEVSRAMGIGPDCAAKLGIERISEAEAVAQTPPPAAPPTDDEVGAGYDATDWRVHRQAGRALRRRQLAGAQALRRDQLKGETPRASVSRCSHRWMLPRRVLGGHLQRGRVSAPRSTTKEGERVLQPARLNGEGRHCCV